MSESPSKIKHVLRKLSEKPEQLSKVATDVAEIAVLPLKLLQDHFHKEIIEKLDTSKVYTAIHESGHLMIDLFNKMPVQNVWMSPFQKKTTSRIFASGGVVVTGPHPINPIRYTRIYKDYKDLMSFFDEEDNGGFPDAVDVQSARVSSNMKVLVQYTYELVAGMAAEYGLYDYANQKSKEEKLKFLIRKSQNGGMKDTEKALDQFDFGNKYEKTNGEILKTLFLLLTEFFSEPEVKQAIELLGKQLMTKKHLKANGSAPLNEELIDFLGENGINRKEFKDLRKRYFEYVDKGMDAFRKILREKVLERKKKMD